ncbi:hypothetical protein DWV48_04220 [Collinsella sp. AF08-23]|nr:hypothetical protein DWV48_04220 [Collinsella sp. AF08-23]
MSEAMSLMCRAMMTLPYVYRPRGLYMAAGHNLLRSVPDAIGCKHHASKVLETLTEHLYFAGTTGK